LRIGLHTSIAGSLERAALDAAALGANTFQIFTSSPRQWKASTPRASDIELLKRARAKHDLVPLVVHGNYLINLAAAHEETRARSIAALRGEIERAVAVGAEYLVAHPGNYKGLSLEQGLANVLHSVAAASAGLDPGPLTLLLENTAGAGTQLGGRLEELAVLRQHLRELTPLRIGFCIDTCHLLVSGYDIAGAAGFRAAVEEIDRLLGLDHIPVIHANDSKAPLGSRVDRHENIGKGYIGEAGFRRILTHPRLRQKAFVLETPVAHPGGGRRDIETLKRLCRKSHTTTTRSS
jgi:deoxyribonuclease-4